MGDRYQGKVAVVTGAASGIGEATARLLVAEGGSVVVADLGADRGRAVADSLGDAAVFAKCDVTVEDEVAAACDLAAEHFGRLDGAFANAGIVGAAGPIATTPMADFDATMAVLSRGVFCTTKHAARVMVEAGNGGSIAMTSSIAGVQGGLGPHVYAMAKTSVIGLARSAASELQHQGIRVNAIAPGNVPTGMTAHVMTGDAANVEKTHEVMDARVPLGRSSTPNDIAEAVVFFFSEAGSWVTGQCLVVDGGQTAAPPMVGRWADPQMVVAFDD